MPIQYWTTQKSISHAFIIFIGLLLTLSSCIITRTPGFYSGYKRLESNQKKKVVIVNDIDELPMLIDSNTYAITAKHLHQFLKNSSRSIIYFWSPNCSGTACIPIQKFINFCQLHKYTPIVISEYYDVEMLAIQGVKPSSVFAINHWHYKTDYCNAYVRRFKQSLFQLFNTQFDKNAYSNYLYVSDTAISIQKPPDLANYPWR
jgi:hypothetical protein